MTDKIPAIEIYQAPSIEPLSLDDVKKYLRIDGDDENDNIELMISTSRISVERYTRSSLIDQKWKLSFNNICPLEVNLPYGPVTAIDSVTSVDYLGTETIIDDANYYLTSGNLAIYFREIPSGEKIEIVYSTGFGAEASDVPTLIRQGMLTHIAYMYERKLPANEVNETAKNLYNVYRNVRI